MVKKQKAFDFLAITIGTLFVAVAVFFFMLPSNLAVGSVSALALVISNFIPLQVSVITMIFNVVLLILGYLLIGKDFAIKTVYATILLPVMLWVFETLLPDFQSLTQDPFLDMIGYVIIVSLGLSILFSYNSSTGGIEVIAKLMNKYLRMELGQAISISGMLVALSSAVCYDSKTVFLSMLGTYLGGLVLDYYIFGLNIKRRVCIISEKHDTSRHINEFTGLDFEMGFIDSFEDVMAMEASMLRYVFDLLNREYAKELAMFNITLPQFDTIPTITFKEGKEITTRLSKKKITDFNDFDADEEKIIGDYIKETTGSDLVFVTHYPSKKRPFYAMDDPTDPTVTLSFDLLLNGAEITTGGQRIHDYDMQVQKMLDRKMDPERFSDYLMIHKYGMPPHGGLGIGLERLTYKLLKLSNIREATLFPRDINILISL